MTKAAAGKLDNRLTASVDEARTSVFRLQGMAKAARAVIGPPGDGRCTEDEELMSVYFVLEAMDTHLNQILAAADQIERIGVPVSA